VPAAPRHHDPLARPAGRVGIVGGGQLARMACQAASAMGLVTVVLAEHADDAAAGAAAELVVGVPTVEKDLRLLAERCDVVTFDHEQVDLALLAALEAAGSVVRPGLATLEMAVDKARMRRRLAAAGIGVPAFTVLDAPDPAAVCAFAADHGWPVVAKAARGGYDGKGVWPVADAAAADAACRRATAAGTALVVEETVAIDAELAVLVARRPGGEAVAWPAVETAQVEGVCREVLVPGRLDPEVTAAAGALARRVADVAGSVGVLAVELFWSAGRLLVNEVAARPHNSGHWTIEGAVTSQFENHLRAVLDLPLGATRPTAPQVASVNVFGAEDGSDPSSRLAGALCVDGAHVHLYGKAPRPGRKLGHVTVCGDEGDDVRARAWEAARALGTPVPAGLALPGGAA
jgi:5-(carboxyamino)imidazole ribonucleotide synthase